MNKFFSVVTAGIFLMSACKEQTPTGLILEQLVSIDTSYVTATPESPQSKTVLIEELTGVACTNCRPGTELLKQMEDQNPGRIITTAIHSGFLTTPTPNSIYDFRNDDADALRLFFNEGDPGKPGATFDRVKVNIAGNDVYFIGKGQTGSDWIATLPTRLSKPTPVNIHLTSDYSTAENQSIIKVKLAFTSAVTDQLALTLYVLEDGKKDIQEDTELGEIHDYEFNHVLKKIITPVGGELILDSLSTKEPGRVLEKSVIYKPEIAGINGLVPDKARIIAIVHKTGTSKEVLHAAEVHLK